MMSRKLAGLVLMVCVLAGCGFKGPLQLPDKEQQREQVE